MVTFLRYNNLVPIGLSVVLLGAGSTLAAQNPELFVASEEVVVAIDNTYLVGLDFTDYSPLVTVLAVEESAESFEIIYQLSTIGLVYGVWQPAEREQKLVVYRELLAGESLENYVTRQLSEVVEAEKRQLLAVQEIEKKQVSQKTVVTSYKGLVGRVIDDKTEVAPAFTPAPVEKRVVQRAPVYLGPLEIKAPALANLVKETGEAEEGDDSKSVAAEDGGDVFNESEDNKEENQNNNEELAEEAKPTETSTTTPEKPVEAETQPKDKGLTTEDSASSSASVTEKETETKAKEEIREEREGVGGITESEVEVGVESAGLVEEVKAGDEF